MAIPSAIIDKLIKSAFTQAFSVGGLYQARHDITSTGFYSPNPYLVAKTLLMKSHKVGILLDDLTTRYSYSEYCKAVASPNKKKRIVDLQLTLTLLEIERFKTFDYNFSIDLPIKTGELNMKQNLIRNFKKSKFCRDYTFIREKIHGTQKTV